MSKQAQLARKVNLPLLVLYGLGTILGAGIYVLVGKVAGKSGPFIPLSFLLAAFIAWVTALSYSQLVILFPKSAGEAVYVDHAFGKRSLTLLVGTLIMLTGTVSAATLASGFVGYFKLLVPISDTLGIILIVSLLCGIAAWGIVESLWISAIITVIEIAGLLMIILMNGDVLLQFPSQATQLFAPTQSLEFLGIAAGAFIAFFAFLGFEDMVNIVEEVKNPKRIMPQAISIAIISATVLYILIAIIAVLAIPLETLANTETPLSLLVESKSASAATIIALIGSFAIVNGILIQIIMASRVAWGMTSQFTNITILASINSFTKTPIAATLFIGIIILILALIFPILTLAKATSYIILVIFSLVNLALVKLKRENKIPRDTKLKSYPLFGSLLCISLLVVQVFSS